MNPTFFGIPLLTFLTWSPLVAGLILAVLPRSSREDGKDPIATAWSLFSTVGIFLVSLKLLCYFDKADPGYQFSEQLQWIRSFGIHYALGIDGISLWLVILATFLMPLIVIASASVGKYLRGYLISMLVLQTAMIGTLVALDVFLFYAFWELMLAPMYFIIGIWGGKRKIYATLKFVLYTVFGSVLMFVAIFYVVWKHMEQTGGSIPSFLLSDLLGTRFSHSEQIWLFGAFALAFGIKVPIFPFHTWLPDAHVEAPTGGSVVLAGVLLKMGLYGFIRFAYPLFPDGAEVFTPVLATLAVIGVIYGALVAWVQTDMKKLVAYSSVSHLGYCVLGLTALNEVSTTGAIYQMLNHGVSTGALFLLVGVLYDRQHTRLIADYGGLTARVPKFAFLFLIFTLSSIALPLTNGFIGEFLILSGSYLKFPLLTCVALGGVILGAVYMLTLYMKTMFGEIDENKNGRLSDVNAREIGMFIPLLILVFVMGLFPNYFLSYMQPSVSAFVEGQQQRAAQSLEASSSGDKKKARSVNEASNQIKNQDVG